jgi:hypothetical protein
MVVTEELYSTSAMFLVIATFSSFLLLLLTLVFGLACAYFN